jgi:hypothetical protein
MSKSLVPSFRRASLQPLDRRLLLATAVIADSSSEAEESASSSSDITITAGSAVYVNALSSAVTGGRWTEARYQWDFGYGSDMHLRKLEGFNAAFYYPAAGDYALTLTVTDADGTHTTTRSITAPQSRICCTRLTWATSIIAARSTLMIC